MPNIGVPDCTPSITITKAPRWLNTKATQDKCDFDAILALKNIKLFLFASLLYLI